MTADDLLEEPAAQIPGQGTFDGAGRPDDATIRAELRGRGHDPPKRARLGADWIALWESGATATDPGDDGEAAGDVTAASPPPAAEPAPAGRAGSKTGERKPRRPKPSGSLRERFWGNAGGGKRESESGRGRGGRNTTTRKPKHARVPVDRIASQLWDFASRSVDDLDKALARCLHYQSPVAGLVVEDVIQGTVFDRALQPLARGEDKFRKLSALVGLPVLVLAVEHAMTLPPAQRAVRLAVLTPMIREAAAQMILLSGEKLDELRAREEEMGPVMEQADALLDEIFGAAMAAPPPPGPADQAAADAQAAATPGGFMFTGPPPAPPPGPYAHPYDGRPPGRVIPGQLVQP